MRKIALAIALLAWPVTAQAQTGKLDVRLTIEESCDVSGAGGSLGSAVLDFGTHSLLQTAITADTGTGADALVVLCNPGTEYTLTFDAGLHAMGDIQNRAMQLQSGSALVSYQLYEDAGRTTVLDTLMGMGTGTEQTITVYGRVPVQTAPPVGN